MRIIVVRRRDRCCRVLSSGRGAGASSSPITLRRFVRRAMTWRSYVDFLLQWAAICALPVVQSPVGGAVCGKPGRRHDQSGPLLALEHDPESGEPGFFFRKENHAQKRRFRGGEQFAWGRHSSASDSTAGRTHEKLLVQGTHRLIGRTLAAPALFIDVAPSLGARLTWADRLRTCQDSFFFRRRGFADESKISKFNVGRGRPLRIFIPMRWARPFPEKKKKNRPAITKTVSVFKRVLPGRGRGPRNIERQGNGARRYAVSSTNKKSWTLEDLQAGAGQQAGQTRQSCRVEGWSGDSGNGGTRHAVPRDFPERVVGAPTTRAKLIAGGSTSLRRSRRLQKLTARTCLGVGPFAPGRTQNGGVKVRRTRISCPAL